MDLGIVVNSICPYCGYKRHFYASTIAEAKVIICQSYENDPVDQRSNGGCKKKYVVDYKLRAQVNSLGIIGEEDGS